MSDNLAAALAELQKQLPTIEKHQTANAGQYQYDYADLADVSGPLLPLLGAVGLSWMCRPTINAAGDFVLAYKLLHTSGDSEEGEYPLPKSGGPQQIGAAITYARRYALCAVTGVAPKGDDNDAAEQPKTRTAQRQTRPAAKQQTAEPAAPRTAQRAFVDGPPLPGDDGPTPITKPQIGKVMVLFGKAGIDEREERLDISRRVIGRQDLGSANELSSSEATRLIDWLQKAEADGFTNALSELLAASGDEGELHREAERKRLSEN